jgi:hypothetical protein
MQVLRRTVVGLFAASILVTLVGCGGLGVNIGSGAKGSGTVAKVTIYVISGPNIPTVLAGHFLTLQAVAYDSRYFVSSTQGAIWSSTGGITLYDPTCTTPAPANPDISVGGQKTTTPTQTICVFGGSFGAARSAIRPQGIAVSKLNATVQNVTGSVDITVQF